MQYKVVVVYITEYLEHKVWNSYHIQWLSGTYHMLSRKCIKTSVLSSITHGWISHLAVVALHAWAASRNFIISVYYEM